MKRIFETLKYIHYKGVCHRDIKSEKIQVFSDFPNPIIKIFGFEFCALFSPGEVMATPLGTPAYLAPEVLSGSYGPEVDCWSCGVIMYVMLCGFFPFEYNDIQDIIKDTPQVSFDYPE